MWKMEYLYQENSSLGHEEQDSESDAKLGRASSIKQFKIAEVMSAVVSYD